MNRFTYRDLFDFGAMLAIILLLFNIAYFAAPVMVDVKIYEVEGKYIYCATGTLTNPPARYVGEGSVPKGDESYC